MTTRLHSLITHTNEPSIPHPTNPKMLLQNPPRPRPRPCPYPHPHPHPHPHPSSSILIHNNQFQIHFPHHLPPISLSSHDSQTRTRARRKPNLTSCTHSRISSSGSPASPSGPFSFSSGSSSFSSGSSSKMAATVVVHPYVLWTFFASLLGFLALSLLRRRNSGNAKSSAQKNKSNTTIVQDKSANSSDDGEFPPIQCSGTDVIVVGAGVAGAALALTLAKEGRRVHVIERDLTEPDRIVGELLQPGGYLRLIELGLEDCVEEIDAQRVLGYVLFKDGKNTRLTYPLEQFHSDVAGRSFHNGRFIQRMREKAARLPNVQLDQGTVTSLLEVNGTIKGVRYKTKDGQELQAHAPLTIVCDGCFSNLRRTLCKPQVPPELHDAFVAAVDKGNIRTMPNRSMPANPQPTPGALLLGDAFNMRHPLTGGGMTVALSDIVVLRDLLKPLGNLHDAASLCIYLESFYTLRKPVASTINTLAGALYKVFSASPDEARTEMRQACFDYLSLGGACSTGPVALLSGLNPRPLNLVLHFFAVAVYGVGRLLLPFPSPRRVLIGARLLLNFIMRTKIVHNVKPFGWFLPVPWISRRSFINELPYKSASGIIFPIIKAEGVRQMFFPAYHRAPPAE